MTAYEWDQRPQSATSAFALLLTTLPREKQAPFFSLHDNPERLDDPLFLAQDAQYFWHQHQGKWDPTAAAFPVSLTHFALMDSAYAQNQDDQRPEMEWLNQFMPRGALVHDYHIGHWWTQVHDPNQRAAICEQTLTLEGSAAASRVLVQLVEEPAESFPPGTFTTTTLTNPLSLSLRAICKS